MLVALITTVGVIQLAPTGESAGPAEKRKQVRPGEPDTAVELTNRFLDAFTSGDATTAASLTDNPGSAASTLAAVWQALAPASLTAGRTGLVEPVARATTADQPYTLTWELGEGRSWSYRATLRLTRQQAGWRIQWRPALVHPRLAEGHRLVLHDHSGLPAVLDRDGAPLLTWTATGTAPAGDPVAPLLLPGMGRTARDTGGTGGWYVGMVDAAGTERAVLHGARAKPLATTLSRPVQRAAQSAVDSQRLGAMMVVIQPSTGDILAVTQNPAAGDRPAALQGLYPPGSTFKIATAAAILESGVAGPGTVVPCPGSVTVGRRTVRNADFELGDVPLRTAFAESCNTTFATLAAGLPPESLPDAANRLGLGADFEIPGITTEAGRARPAASTAEQVENSIGQGTVAASCFGLAVMTATVAGGRAVTPRLWRDLPTRVAAGYQPPSDAVLGSLRSMMREVVTTGRGAGLARFGDVHGKTGTAEVSDGTGTHGWFVGYRGDLAFATLVLDAASSSVAVAVTGTFLGALG